MPFMDSGTLVPSRSLLQPSAPQHHVDLTGCVSAPTHSHSFLTPQTQ